MLHGKTTAIDGPNSLTAAEADRMLKLEVTVQKGLADFKRVGEALLEIRDSRLYRAKHGTFAAYMEHRWGLTARRGYSLIRESEAAKSVKHASHLEPNARQSAELSKIKDPTERAEVWRSVVEEHGEAVTAAAVAKAVEQHPTQLRRRAKASFGAWRRAFEKATKEGKIPGHVSESIHAINENIATASREWWGA